MLNWLSHWGRRLWRSCCYPFQFWPFRDSRSKVATNVSVDSAAREFPSSRVEAIRQGILVPPQGETPLNDLALDESGAEAELDLEEALFLSGEASAEQLVDASLFESSVLEAEGTLSSPKIGEGISRLKRGVKASEGELPFDWVLDNLLAIGALPRKGWAKDFKDHGIHVILSLCDEAEGKLPKAIAQQFRCVRVPLPDSRYRRSLTVEELGDAVDLIHWHVQKNQPVYLHCLAGIERSPLVAIAYLARHRSMDLLDAVGWLSHVHRRSRPIPAQLQVVRAYLQNCG